MHDGKVEQIGSPLELYDRPGNLFVAGFIGSPAMNFIKGTLRRSSGDAWVEAPGGVRLAAGPHAAGKEGQEVVYGVRPEHLAVVGEGEAAAVPATVTVVEPTGADTFVYGEIAGAQMCAVFAERHDFSPGQQIYLQPKVPVTHLFDAASGTKLH
jgi:multiple sugar transport system ATP-binding protein